MTRLLLLCLFAIPLCTVAQPNRPVAPATFSISFPASRSSTALDGRVLLILAKTDKTEPRQQVSDAIETAQIFGVDIDGMKPGQPVVVGANAFGYPKRSLRDLPPGEYFVQAVLHKYETFRVKNGPNGTRRTVKLPMDRGEGQNWRTAPGNLFSKPQKITIKTGANQSFAVVMDQVNPPITEPNDTKFIKHIKIQSKRLTEFWGRPMYLGANVLLPAGFAEHPEVPHLYQPRSLPGRLRRLQRDAPARQHGHDRLHRAVQTLRLQKNSGAGSV